MHDRLIERLGLDKQGFKPDPEKPKIEQQRADIDFCLALLGADEEETSE